MSAEAARELVAALGRGTYACPRCAFRARYGELGRLPSLSCPRCAVALVHDPGSERLAPSHGSSGPPSGSGPVDSAQPPGAAGSGPPSAQGSAPSPASGSDGSVGHDSSTHGGVDARTLGPYQLLSEIGRGSNGVVYLARREGLDRSFAVKVLKGADEADGETLARFRLEAAVASKLRHPGIVGVHDVGLEGGSCYYAMDHCPGTTLKSRFQTGPLPAREAAEVVAALAEALAAAHAEGVIHRDVKPANVILHEGRPRLTDFGLARDRSLLRSMTQTGDVIGTPYYMAPEQFQGRKDLDHRIDIYALGVILYQALTGHRPFKAGTAVALGDRVCRGPPPVPPTRLDADIPPALERICLRAMARDPDDRYASAGALAEDLRRFAEGKASRRERWGRGARRALAVGLGVLSVVAAAVVVRTGPWGRLDGSSAESPPSPEASSPPEPVGPEELLARARELLAERVRAGDSAPYPRVELALRRAREAATGDEEAAEAELAFARFLARRGRSDEALEACAPFEERRGTRAGLQALLLEARIQEARDDVPAARDAYEALEQELDPAGSAGLTAAAALHRLDHRPQRAVDLARGVVRRDPAFAPAQLELGLALLALGGDDRVSEAQEALDAAYAEAIDDPRVHLGLSLVWLRLERDGAAEQELRLSQALLAPDVRGEAGSRARVLVRALVAAHRGDLSEARQGLGGLLERDPGHVEARVHRGALRSRDGEEEAAEQDWARAREISSERFERVVQAWYPDLEIDVDDDASAGGATAGSWWTELSQGEGAAGASGAGGDGRLEDLAWGELSVAAEERIEERLRGVTGFVADDLRKALEAAARGERTSEVAFLAKRALHFAEGTRVAFEAAALLAARDRCAAAEKALEGLREVEGASRARLDRLAGEVRWRQGRLARAQRLLARAAEAGGAEGACAAAEAAFVRGELEQAREAAAAALEQTPEHTGLRTTLALALYGLGEPAAAARAARRVHEQDGLRDTRLLALVYLERSSSAPVPWLGTTKRHPVLATTEGVFCRRLAVALAAANGEAVESPRVERLVEQLRGGAGRADVAWTLGRYALAASAPREAVLEHWRAAARMDPDWSSLPGDARRYEERFGEPLPDLR